MVIFILSNSAIIYHSSHQLSNAHLKFNFKLRHTLLPIIWARLQTIFQRIFSSLKAFYNYQWPSPYNTSQPRHPGFKTFSTFFEITKGMTLSYFELFTCNSNYTANKLKNTKHLLLTTNLSSLNRLTIINLPTSSPSIQIYWSKK